MHLASIHIYPVKALRGISVSASLVEPWGLAGDRRWMVVDSLGRLLSQREAPGLALIDATPDGDSIRLSSPGRPSILVPRPDVGHRVEVQLWRERVPAVSAGERADEWLSTTRGSYCRLVFMAEPERARPVQVEGREMDHVSFADDSPLLLTNVASLADLAGRSTLSTLAMDRFRPNLVVEGASAWAEDDWREVTIGEARFDVIGPCERCVVTVIDQQTGERQASNEPMRTLLSFRRNARGRPIFGINLVPRSGGIIVINDDFTAK
jgi:uncharacterized protein YcbX